MGYHDEKTEDTDSPFKSTEKLCSSIRLGDFLLLQGRPCQVIKISRPSGTGQYRYLGADVLSQQLHEESSFTSTSESEQAARVLDFMSWPILDIGDGVATAMNETGDVKQDVRVNDNGNLLSRLRRAVESGRGKIYGLVLHDKGQDLIVEMKVEYGEGN
ncbi:unnamed protein product [Penicillium olsonii]|nr:unnamed protein product [Penicillium olsonii]